MISGSPTSAKCAAAKGANGKRGSAERAPAGTPSALTAYRFKGFAPSPMVSRCACRPLAFAEGAPCYLSLLQFPLSQCSVLGL
jgi:hypothetical protein